MVFREILGEDVVLEHHGNFVPEDADWRSRLTAESWDMPLVVTTMCSSLILFFPTRPPNAENCIMLQTVW